MQTYHNGPVEYIGSRFRRSIPRNITSVRSRNRSKDMSIQRGLVGTMYGKQRTKIREVEWVDKDLFKECKNRTAALVLAKLWLEPIILKCRKKYYVRMV